ncbi:MAG TPA: L-histidine N(alpha)-methyltransferase [Moraxellaceae bacterium]|nr:L-histidine N(alpha)-methyltransferase [Moraxellaceae bacterium]
MASWLDVVLPGESPRRHSPSPVSESVLLLHAREGTREERRQELLDGLLAERAMLPPKYFYDAQGCALYQAICQLDEYYPVATEAALFARVRDEIVALLPQHAQWIDLGCGDGNKSWPWLSAVDAARFVGVDISEDWLHATLREAKHRFPDIEHEGIVCDFTRTLDLPSVREESGSRPPVFFYPGSSISNFSPADTLHFLQAIWRHLGERGVLLICVDGQQDPVRLRAAYDDALGVTAAFNRNVLRVVNHALGADFRPERFHHRAVFNAEESRVELSLVATEDHVVHLGGHPRRFQAGESILTEYSYKYSGPAFAALLEIAGFGNLHHWQSSDAGYHVFLAGRRPLS